MHPFAVSRADDAAKAIAAHALDPELAFIAGGTDLIGLMKDRAALPERLLDINGLAEYGADRSAARRWPAHRSAGPDERRGGRYRRYVDAFLSLPRHCCSPHPANCATWRRSAATSCSGRAAPISATRPMAAATSGDRAPAVRRSTALIAITRSSDGLTSCVATNPSDLAVALAALDAIVDRAGQSGRTTNSVHRFPSPARRHARA